MKKRLFLVMTMLVVVAMALLLPAFGEAPEETRYCKGCDAQMTYCAITGESAVGKDYSFWNDTTKSSSFKLSSYLSTYYAYDSKVPSNSNFQTIFNTPLEMTALQKLIDQYLEEKGYRNY